MFESTFDKLGKVLSEAIAKQIDSDMMYHFYVWNHRHLNRKSHKRKRAIYKAKRNLLR